VLGVVVDIFAILEEWGRHRPRLAIWTINRSRAVLGQIDAAHAVGLVRSAAMEDEAVEGDDASRRHNQGITRIVARVADEIVSHGLLDVVDDRALLFTYIIQRAPAGHIRPVLRAGVVPLHVAAVLVPRKLHPLLGALDDPLLG